MGDSELFCPIRGRTVASLPEEKVRVRLINALLSQLGFPKSGIAIEKELSQMPHLTKKSNPLPQRRADIICFANGIHPKAPLYPLLLIECKGVPLTLKMRNQVIGYNHYCGAYFVALVNQNESFMGWLDRAKGEYQWVSGLPHYSNLVSSLRRSDEKGAIVYSFFDTATGEAKKSSGG